MSTRIKTWSALLAMAAVVLGGCGSPSVPRDEPAAATEGASVKMTPELEAKLAIADRADGEEDHVVARCPGCNLAMEGEADHTVEIGDYALQFCSDTCQDTFSEDLEGSLIALVVPEEEEAPEEDAQDQAQP